jgi:FtsZ-interacting cell division protein YlmF
MLDYLSGGCSAIGARMEKVAVGVFLLDPTTTPRE